MVGKIGEKEQKLKTGKATGKPPLLPSPASSGSMAEVAEVTKADLKEDSSNGDYIRQGIIIPKRTVLLFVWF